MLGLLIDQTVAALEAEGDVQLAIGAIGSSHDALAAFHIHRCRLLDVDMLAGLDGCFEVFRVEEDGSRNDDGIDVARQHLSKVLVEFRILDTDAFLRLLHLLFEEIAERNDPRRRVLRHHCGYERAAIARADHSDGDGGICRRSPGKTGSRNRSPNHVPTR